MMLADVPSSMRKKGPDEHDVAPHMRKKGPDES